MCVPPRYLFLKFVLHTLYCPGCCYLPALRNFCLLCLLMFCLLVAYLLFFAPFSVCFVLMHFLRFLLIFVLFSCYLLVKFVLCDLFVIGSLCVIFPLCPHIAVCMICCFFHYLLLCSRSTYTFHATSSLSSGSFYLVFAPWDICIFARLASLHCLYFSDPSSFSACSLGTVWPGFALCALFGQVLLCALFGQVLLYLLEQFIRK